MENWISAVIINTKNGDKALHQFDNEEQLRYFLACNEGRKVLKVIYHMDGTWGGVFIYVGKDSYEITN